MFIRIAVVSILSASLLSGCPFDIPCALLIQNNQAQFDAAGGHGLIAVEATGDCTWPVTTDADWIFLEQTSLIGSGEVGYVVEQNVGLARTGAIHLGDAEVTVTQAANCAISLDTASIEVVPGGGEYTIEITALDVREWEIDTSADWITLGAMAGVGSEVVPIFIMPSDAAGRQATIEVGDQVLEVRQAPCSIKVFPDNGWLDPDPHAIEPEFTVTAPDGCPWTVVGEGPGTWYISPTSGIGNGTFEVLGTSNEQGDWNVYVNDVPIGITNYTGCNDDPSVARLEVPADGGTYEEFLDRGCGPWSYNNLYDWITLTPSSADESQVVSVSVAPNLGIARRAGFVIGRTEFQIEQDQICEAVPSTDVVELGPAGGTRLVQVNAEPDCMWQARSTASWLVLQDTGLMTGTEILRINILPNDRRERTGRIFVGNTSFTVIQGGT